MIRVIGSASCSRCIAVKNALTNKGVKYTYTHIEDLPEEERSKIQKDAIEAKKPQLPIIYQDNKIVHFQEVSV